MESFRDRTALVTGASSGIGRAFAQRLAASGASLVLVARREAVLEEIAADLRARHRVSVTTIGQDLARPEGASRLASKLSDKQIEVDVLINNAGLGIHGDLATAPVTNAVTMVAVNVASLTELTALLLPAMIARRRGVVINIASTAAYQPVPHMAVYSATKAYVLAFTRALWGETRGTGVRVLAVSPGATDTAFFDIAGDDASVGSRRSPEQVVDTTLRALARKRPSVVDGGSNAFVAWIAPRVRERTSIGIAERSVRPRD